MTRILWAIYFIVTPSSVAVVFLSSVEMAIFLSLSFLLFICQNTEVEGMVRTYGQNCEDGGPCLGAHVSCLATGVCGCSSADDMIYDHSIRDCVANLGKVCGLDSECIEGALCIEGICVRSRKMFMRITMPLIFYYFFVEMRIRILCFSRRNLCSEESTQGVL